LLSRILQGVALVVAVVILNFVLVHAAPGDPVETIAGVSSSMFRKACVPPAHSAASQ
jgi:peptide/nickel transport system permease protein